jgi:hypothetical protein
MGTPPPSPIGPRFGSSPDSGRPPAETTPGGRPATTAPVDSTGLAGDAAGGELRCGTPCPAGLTVLDSPAAAGQTLVQLFLANADRGDNAANDHLVAALVRRIRTQQHSRDGGETGDHWRDADGTPIPARYRIE